MLYQTLHTGVKGHHGCYELSPDSPESRSHHRPSSASDALCDLLAAVATANQRLTVTPPSDTGLVPDRHRDRAAVPFEELKAGSRKPVEAMVKIAAEHAQLTSWSVTVGMPLPFSITVNFANRPKPGPDSDFSKRG